MTKNDDVCIVGGGLAGSAAAIRLRKAGKSVVLIEKQQSAHHKVCGEFLSGEAVQDLQNLGLNLDQLGAVTLKEVRLVKDQKLVSSPLPFEAKSLSRHVLDEALLKFAFAEGAEIKRGITADRLSQQADGLWCVHGKEFEARAHSLFLATGKHDIRHWKRPQGVKNDYIGFKMHYRLTDKQAELLAGHTDIILFKGGYAGMQPIEAGKANLCLVIEKQRFSWFNKDWHTFLQDLLQHTPYLAGILQAAEPLWQKPLAIYGIPYGYVCDSKENEVKNFYRLGDQQAVIPSFAGGGMAIALHTAKLAIHHYLTTGCRSYNVAARQQLKTHIGKSTLLGRLLTSSLSQHAAISLLSVMPTLLTRTASFTRLPGHCKKTGENIARDDHKVS